MRNLALEKFNAFHELLVIDIMLSNTRGGEYLLPIDKDNINIPDQTVIGAKRHRYDIISSFRKLPIPPQVKYSKHRSFHSRKRLHRRVT